MQLKFVMADFPGSARLHYHQWCVAYQEHVYISRKASSRKSIIIGDSLVKNFSRGKSAAIFDEHFPDGQVRVGGCWEALRISNGGV